jgi:hypothetical protein
MAAGTVAAIGAGMSIYQMAQGAKDENDASNALSNYERQELNNVYKDVQISTIGSDQLKEQADSTTAGMIDMARTGGVRGIMGALPRIQANSNAINQESRKYLDDQNIQRSYAIAGDEKRIQGMTEQRQNAEISGLGQQMEVGRQTMWNGINGLGNSLIYGANNIDFKGDGGQNREQIDPISNTMKASGVSLDSYSEVLKTQQEQLQQSAYLPKFNI